MSLLYFNFVSFLHAILGIFAGGRSNAKVYLFIGYFFILLIITVFLKKDFSIRLRKITRATFWISLVAGHILAVAAFVDYSNEYKFEINDFIITFNNEEISSTQLSHNHVLKGSTATLLDFFGKGKHENIDAGLPFIELISDWVLWTGLFLIIISALSSLFLFSIEIYYRNGLYKKIIFLLAFSLSVFPLIKSIADGGIFLANSLPILAALVWGICEKKKAVRYSISILLLYSAWTIIAWKFFFFEKDYQLTTHLFGGLTAFFIIATLFYLDKYAKKRIHYLFGMVAILLILFYPVYTELTELFKYRSYMATDSIVALYNISNFEEGEKISNIGSLEFYRVKDSVSVNSLINKYRLLDNIYPISVPWKTCVPTSLGDEYKFFLNTTDGQDVNINNFGLDQSGKVLPQFNYARADLIGTEGFISRYEISINVKSCFPRHLNLIEELLKTKFSEPFFVYNIIKI